MSEEARKNAAPGDAREAGDFLEDAQLVQAPGDAQVKQAQRGAAAQQQGGAAKTPCGTHEKTPFADRWQRFIDTVTDEIERGRNFVEILIDELLGSAARMVVQRRIGHVAQVAM